MTEMTKNRKNTPFCTEWLKYKQNKPFLSTFSEPGLQEIPGDYTQASKMNKITGINDRKH